MRVIYLVFPCLCCLFVVSRFFCSGLAIFTCFSGEIPECLMKFIDLKHLTLNNNYLHGSIPELPAESQLVILALHRNWVVVWFLLFYFHPYLLGFQKNQIQQFGELKHGEKTPRKPADWNYHWILTTTSTVGCAHLAWPFELQKFPEGSNPPATQDFQQMKGLFGIPY